MDIIIYKKDEKNQTFQIELPLEEKEHQFSHSNYTLSFQIKVLRMNSPKLILHYDFQGSMKLIVRDKSISNIKGEFKHLKSIQPEFCEGRKKDEKAISFNGFNYIECFANPIKDLADLSVSIWFKVDDPQIDGVLISTLENNNGISISFFNTLFYDVKGTKFHYLKEEIEIDTTLRNEAFKIDQWNNKIVTYNGKFLNEYLNGKLINQIKCAKMPISEGRKLTVGASINGMDFNGFKGDIANLKIFNYLLSEKEIESIQNE